MPQSSTRKRIAIDACLVYLLFVFSCDDVKQDGVAVIQCHHQAALDQLLSAGRRFCRHSPVCPLVVCTCHGCSLRREGGREGREGGREGAVVLGGWWAGWRRGDGVTGFGCGEPLGPTKDRFELWGQPRVIKNISI